MIFQKKCQYSKRLAIILTSCLLAILANYSYANEELTRELMERISESKNALQIVEKGIAKKSLAIARRLNKQQKNIKKLRAQASSMQRVADEKLLSLEQLETRVNLWSSQSNYQKQLLTSFVENIALPIDNLKKMDGDVVVDASVLPILSEQLTGLLSPRWHEIDTITPSGIVEKTSAINIGPIELAYNAKKHSGGPINRDNINEPMVLANIYDTNALKELNSIQASGVGYLTFDPTLGNAYKLKGQEQGVLGHIEKGGIWALPILFFGLLSLIVSILKATQLLRLPKVDLQLIERLKATMHVNNNNQDKSVQFKNLSDDCRGAQKKLIEIAMSIPISQERDDLLVAYLLEYKHKIERFLGAIATSAAIAPLLGLLGTVSGMISTFMMMTIFGTGDASTVSGGISEALITTELGLIVAIPSLIISALLNRKTKSYSAKLENNAIKLSKINFA